MTYADDVDLNIKLKNWEEFYNYIRLHGAFEGKSPYEKLNIVLKSIYKSPPIVEILQFIIDYQLLQKEITLQNK